jgi:NIMA (never in mitosis gene a)-related kinase 1/4/5
LQDFVIKEKIGSGSYGVVFKVVRKLDRMHYAMKEIDLAGMSRKEQEECIRETRVLSSLDSDFIIKYYDSFLERVRMPMQLLAHQPGAAMAQWWNF